MGTMRVLLRNFIKNRDPHSRCRAIRRDLHRRFKICNAIVQTLQIKSVTFDLQDLLQSIIFVADIKSEWL